MSNWKILFKGVIEGREVTLSQYLNESFKVLTTQIETETTEPYSDGSSHVFPIVVSKGDEIEVEGNTSTELYNELIEIGFSIEAAKLIISKI